MGGLYSQFGSKERLAVEALDLALADSGLARLPAEGNGKALARAIARYLAPAHRDAVDEGCPLAALATDLPREGPAVRRIFTDAVRDRAARIAGLLPDHEAQRDDRAMAMLATLVGALALARAVDDPDLSDRILAGARRTLQQELLAG